MPAAISPMGATILIRRPVDRSDVGQPQRADGDAGQQQAEDQGDDVALGASSPDLQIADVDREVEGQGGLAGRGDLGVGDVPSSSAPPASSLPLTRTEPRSVAYLTTTRVSGGTITVRLPRSTVSPVAGVVGQRRAGPGRPSDCRRRPNRRRPGTALAEVYARTGLSMVGRWAAGDRALSQAWRRRATTPSASRPRARPNQVATSRGDPDDQQSTGEVRGHRHRDAEVVGDARARTSPVRPGSA